MSLKPIEMIEINNGATAATVNAHTTWRIRKKSKHMTR